MSEYIRVWNSSERVNLAAKLTLHFTVLDSVVDCIKSCQICGTWHPPWP